MSEKLDVGQVGCRTTGMSDNWNFGQVECRTSGMSDKCEFYFLGEFVLTCPTFCRISEMSDKRDNQ